MGLNIGVDLDGVLADFNTAYIDLCIKTSGKNLFPLKPFDIPCWNYPEHYGYTKQDVSATWKAINSDAYFWRTLRPYHYTQDVLAYLWSIQDKLNASIYYITTRTGVNPKWQSELWLADFAPKGRELTVLISKHKGMIAQGLELDIFIDDKVENCVDVVNACGLSCQVYMLDQPWNREFTDLRSIKRIKNVHEALDEVMQHA